MARLGGARGVTLVELAIVLGLCVLVTGSAAPIVAGALDAHRLQGAVADIYGAVHLTRARARTTGVMHALVIEPDGRGFRIVEDPGGTAVTVVGPSALPDGATAAANTTIRFSPKGFAVPFGTITVRAGPEARRVIVNLLGRVRVG